MVGRNSRWEEADERDDEDGEEERRRQRRRRRRQRREEIVEIVEERPAVLETEADRKLLRLAVDGKRVGDTEAREVLT